MRLQGALLGAGNIALRGHAPQWAGDEWLRREAEIVAVADLSAENLKQAGRVFPEARLYREAEELIEHEALDFADVCTPPFTRRALIEQIAARGVHVLCEKPLALAFAEAEHIARAVRRAKVVFHPCHQYHHSPQWRTLRAQLPRLGRIYLAEYEVDRTRADQGNPNWRPAWRTDRRLSGGGILVDHGAHIFYQLRAVLGEPGRVQATVRTLRHRDYGVEDTALVVLDHGDCLAQVRLNWAARRREIRFRFVGEKGEIVGDERGLRIEVRGRASEVAFPAGMSRDSSHAEWYRPLLRVFSRRMRTADRGTETLDEAVYVTRLITRAYESSDQGRARPL